jgi:hypothetical protein
MKSIFTAILLVCFIGSVADAKGRRHQKTINPVAQGLGYGLGHMLDSASNPVYLPDLLPIPPYGWPFKPFYWARVF